MNKRIGFLTLIVSALMHGMDQGDQIAYFSIDNDLAFMQRETVDSEFNDFFNDIISPILAKKEPQNFLKKAASIQKQQFINPNLFRIVENSEIAYSGQIFDIPAPNTYEHKKSKRSASTENLDHLDNVLNHMLEEAVKRNKITPSKNKKVKQAYGF